jgi:hypothetical protein
MKLCGFEVGLRQPFFLIAGPCAIETEKLALESAAELKRITGDLRIPFIYKSSFDKANRSSHKSARGVGIEEGLRILEKVKREIGVPVLTDVHEDTPIDEVAAVVDVLQTPAFLCRQTNFIQRVAAAGKPVNIKKGQFLAPWDMKHVVAKAQAAGNQQIMVCERGAPSGTTIWCPICAHWLSCAIQVVRWYSMQLTRCSYRAGRAIHPEASANLYRCWRAPLSPSAWRACLWKRTRNRRKRSATVRMPGRLA